MKVSFLDVQSQNKFLKKKTLQALERVLERGDFILGQDVSSFEEEFSKYCRSKYCVGVNSGTDALFLSLLSMGIGPGDEVICPVYTYIASALSISYTGAIPVFVDIDKETFNVNPAKIKAKITKKTKAIMAVHLYGRPADMEAINKIARKFKLKVIEDAAQAQGAALFIKGKWQKVGTFSEAGCFSFYPTKNLSGCGDAGCITTNSKKVFENLLSLRDQGRKIGKNRYLHFIKGYNSRLDTFQAAILRIKLKFLDEQNNKRRNIANFYTRALKDVKGVKISDQPKVVRNVYHIYPVLIKKNRDMVHEKLQLAGISSAIVYNLPLHLQRAYKGLNHKRGDFPVAEEISGQILCLPMHSNINGKQAVYVTQMLKKIIG